MTYGEAIEKITSFYSLSPEEAEDRIEQAIEDGKLTEDQSGTFPQLQIPGYQPSSEDETKTAEPDTVNGTDTDPDTVYDCFSVIIEFYHSQLDTEIEHGEFDTPREYFEEERGWSPETIKEAKLGFAPPDHEGRLRDHLFSKGYSAKTMLATGILGRRDNGRWYTIWNGRYVFPYFDEAGEPTYAISRAMYPPHPEDWAGRFDENDDPEKYHVIPSNDGVYVTKPIYGAHSVESDEPVVITEGIADAITAHQAGYPCLSPVTTQFSSKNIDQLLHVLEDSQIDQVFVIQDAEIPSSGVTKDNELMLDQYGSGAKGAVRTASLLVDEGIDARVGTLPRPGLEKVDVDDYLVEWSNDLSAVLRSAKPPAQHPASNPTSQDRDTGQDQNSPEDGSHQSGTFSDLDITDVTGLDVGFRGKNPLGHRGSREDYFKVYEHKGEKLAYDHKYKVTYNALTYLLCEEGERHASRPQGPLSDEEVWKAFQHAKSQGYIEKGSKCPARALKHIALKHDVCTRESIEDGWKLPAGAFVETLGIIESEYTVSHGHDNVPSDYSGVQIERLRALEWPRQKRYARNRGYDWPSTSEARTRLEDSIINTVAHQDSKVIDAPTALGKSYTVATFPWLRHREVRNGSPVIHLHATKAARKEASQASKQAGLKSKQLRGRTEICPVCAGDFDDSLTVNGEPASEWITRQCDGKGIPLSAVHGMLERLNDQGKELPCSPEEDECPSKTQWDDVPWDNPTNSENGCIGGAEAEPPDGEVVKYDIVHATHPMLFVPSMTKETNVIIDELPNYALQITNDGDDRNGISMGRIQRAVTAYLTEIDAPVTTWEDFIVANSRRDAYGSMWGEYAEFYQELTNCIEEQSPSLDWYIEEPKAHVLVKAIIECILDAFGNDADANGLRTGTATHTLPRMDSEQAVVRVSLVIDENNQIRSIRRTPDLSNTRSVVGLDAHPAMPLWQLNSIEDIERLQVLSSQERTRWRRYERGLFTVQVGEYTRPLSGMNATEWFDDVKIDALLGELVDEGLRTGITTTQVEGDLQQLFKKNGVHDRETMHYGEVRSRNNFGDEDIGFVNGCMDPGDDYILNVLCEYGCQATPETTTGDDGDEHRAHGRGFVGPDAETAAEILASVRENEVAQAAGRYARNPEKKDDRAVVYVRTDATPQGFTDVQVDGVQWSATEKQRTIIETLQSSTKSTAKEIADGLNVTKRHVLKTLNRLRMRGLIECEEGAGSYGADLFRSIDGVTKSAVTKLGPTYITNDASIDSSTWSFVILGTDDTETGATHYDDSPSSNNITSTLSIQSPSPIQPPAKLEDTSETASSQSDGRWIVDGDVVAL